MEIALVYMVAGMSSRFGGKIKQFAKVTDKETLIEYSIKQALPAGFTKIVFIVGAKTEVPFKEMFGNNFKGVPVQYAFQNCDFSLRDKPWGTVDALCSAKDFLNCPFVVCNGDDLYGENAFKILVNHLKKNSNQKNLNATVGYRLKNVIPEQGKVNRGIFEADSNNEIISLKEVFEIERLNIKEKGLNNEDLCSMNMFAFHPETLNLLSNILKDFKEKNKHDRKIECLLPEEIGKLIRQGKIKVKIYPTEDKWFGVTNPGDEDFIRERLVQP